MSLRDARLGSTIGGKYRIARFLAEGGMGTVYEAQHLVVKRRFAVKFLRSELLRRRDVLARFTLEAESAGALESENIAAALDFGMTNDGDPYIVMEYLDGITLAALLSGHGPLPFARAADLVVQASSGTQRAHDAGVLHRDLKPQNLFVCRRSDETDLVKIVDFGVAKLLGEGAASGITSTGGMVGTPSYMSPEQARGEPSIDRRADVYALGVILYELLSGQTPHPGESYNAVIHHISTQPALPLAGEGRDIPPALIAVVERALASRPDDRQASASELARELMPFARRQAWPVVSAPALPGFDATVLAPDAAGSADPKLADGASAVPIDTSGARPPARKGWAQLSLAALTLALVVFVAALWPGARLAAPPPEPHAASPATSTSAEPVRTRPPDTAEPIALPAPVPERAVALLPIPKPAPAGKPKPINTARKVPTDTSTKPKARAEFDEQNPY